MYAFLQRAGAPQDTSAAKKGSHYTVDFPNAKHYRTGDEFFGDDEIELVIVCSHTDTHASFSEQALKAGKHGNSSFHASSSSHAMLMTVCSGC